MVDGRAASRATAVAAIAPIAAAVQRGEQRYGVKQQCSDAVRVAMLQDDNNGNESHSIEKWAIPNLTLKVL
ncbi:hypothetical protein F0562_001897 [Nyssa sinensis]|uniref:Uncharacterized protein n=1 Tax=Nyssa sinensis TaxID=561372 RepID=A0A5J5C495_9ASTE|nr:hypothetical protein F0562_001897 [Nyssa sinensis]